MEDLFGRSFASAALNSCIACKVLSLTFGWGSQSVVSFVVGHPLGYSSSWPLSFLHILVWHCAEKVHPGKYFDRYAILGDDIVMANSRVASVYEAAPISELIYLIKSF